MIDGSELYYQRLYYLLFKFILIPKLCNIYFSIYRKIKTSEEANHVHGY